MAELSFNLPGWSANADLKAVTTNSFEALLGRETSSYKVSGGLFAQFVRNSLLSQQPASPFNFRTLANGPGYDIRGLELEGEATFKNHTVRLAYAFQRTADAESGERVADLPSHLATLSATLALNRRWSLSPLCTLRSSRPRAPGDTRAGVGTALTVDVNLQAVKLFRSLEALGSLRNVFNAESVDPAPLLTVPGDYPLAGRWALIQLSWKF
jgi:outer membrane cobalamin receptor